MIDGDSVQVTPRDDCVEAGRGKGYDVLASAVKHLRSRIRVDKNFSSAIDTNSGGCRQYEVLGAKRQGQVKAWQCLRLSKHPSVFPFVPEDNKKVSASFITTILTFGEI